MDTEVEGKKASEEEQTQDGAHGRHCGSVRESSSCRQQLQSLRCGEGFC